jgi:hypothetical protein
LFNVEFNSPVLLLNAVLRRPLNCALPSWSGDARLRWVPGLGIREIGEKVDHYFIGVI